MPLDGPLSWVVDANVGIEVVLFWEMSLPATEPRELPPSSALGLLLKSDQISRFAYCSHEFSRNIGPPPQSLNGRVRQNSTASCLVSRTLGLVYSDLCDPISPATQNNKKYILRYRHLGITLVTQYCQKPAERLLHTLHLLLCC